MSSSFCTFFTAIRTAYVSIPNGRMIQDKRAASWNFYHNAAISSRLNILPTSHLGLQCNV